MDDTASAETCPPGHPNQTKRNPTCLVGCVAAFNRPTDLPLKACSRMHTGHWKIGIYNRAVQLFSDHCPISLLFKLLFSPVAQ